MHRLLAEAERILGVRLPALRAASAWTDEQIRISRSTIARVTALGCLEEQRPVLVAAFGSMGRRDMGPGSDLDYLIVMNQTEPDPEIVALYQDAVWAAVRAIGARAPGSSGLFGVAIGEAELTDSIGTRAGQQMYRRILLLQESAPLNSEHYWHELVEGVAVGYFSGEMRKKTRIPLLLVGDVLRYWRAVEADYQMKRLRDPGGPKSALRFVKQVSTRKLTFASMVGSLFAPVILGVEPSPSFLVDQYTLPGVTRLAQFAEYFGDDNQARLAAVLCMADAAVALLSDASFRGALEAVGDPRLAVESEVMMEALSRGRELDRALDGLLLSEEDLPVDRACRMANLTRGYLWP